MISNEIDATVIREGERYDVDVIKIRRARDRRGSNYEYTYILFFQFDKDDFPGDPKDHWQTSAPRDSAIVVMTIGDTGIPLYGNGNTDYEQATFEASAEQAQTTSTIKFMSGGYPISNDIEDVWNRSDL